MLVELSVPIHSSVPKFDDSIPDYLIGEHSRIARGDANNTSTISMFLHFGSHVDAPFHFDQHGSTIDEIPIEDFIYKKVVIANLAPTKCIKADSLRSIPGIETADLLLLYTGYSLYIHDNGKYNVDFPVLDYSAACYLRRELPKLKAVGTDAISIELDDGSNTFPIHHELLDMKNRSERPLLIFENINLTEVVDKRIEKIWAFPLRLVGLDASPITMVAKIDA